MPPSPQELLAELASAFPRQKIEAPTLRIYLRELADVPPELLAVAVRDLIRTSEWFPTLQAILEAAAERSLALPSESGALAQIEARMAWVRSEAFETAPGPPVHPLVRETLEHVGGFSAFRATDEPGVLRGQFLRLYRDARGRAVRDAKLADALPPGSSPRALGP